MFFKVFACTNLYYAAQWLCVFISFLVCKHLRGKCVNTKVSRQNNCPLVRCVEFPEFRVRSYPHFTLMDASMLISATCQYPHFMPPSLMASGFVVSDYYLSVVRDLWDSEEFKWNAAIGYL